MIPSLSNGERSVFLNDVEEDSGDGLGVLRWGFKLNGFHLRLPFLRQIPYRCPKHDSGKISSVLYRFSQKALFPLVVVVLLLLLRQLVGAD